MVCIRITSKLAKRYKAPFSSSLEESTGLLGGWYVNLLILYRQHLLLAVSERTLLPLLLFAKPIRTFPERIGPELGAMLKRLDVDPTKVESEVNSMSRWVIAKTTNRSVLGSMNDFTRMLDYYIEQPRPLIEYSLELADSPCKPLGMDNPIEATRAIFGR